MKNRVAFACVALASFAAASAQPIIMPGNTPGPMQGAEPPAASAFGPDPVIQITTTFRARIEGVADAREVPSTTAQDSARRTLYNMAANECTVLAEYWKAECRLNSFSVYVSLESLVGPGAEREVPSMYGTAVYELRLQSSGGSR
ncbi:MAG TPA: hypothetical protein VKY22_04415 [Bradyrhizobium sp.]|nr:hypothetical protein [Bradyrhizobium sp.]